MFKIFNTLTRKEEIFTPTDRNHIKMYVCGPTVYDRPHIGNARSIVFYDILFRLLQILYPKVTFVRNITDVDDKIIKRAGEEGISTDELTAKVISQFQEDVAAIHCLRPTFEPKATQYIPQMLEMIKTLISSNNAYIAENGDVMFSVLSFADYGQLSHRKISEMQAGARISVSQFKKHEHDFVLWKKVNEGEVGWSSEFSFGRPGWHIECSAMSVSLLGMDFDIHGGGVDLQFPHHENEIAQSQCAYPNQKFAKYWVHNGFLTVEGEKMSKSLGNFITIKDLLNASYTGNEIRFVLLNTHYRKPLSFSNHAIETARLAIQKFQKTFDANREIVKDLSHDLEWSDIPPLAQAALLDNINISKFTAIMHGLVNDIKNTNDLKGRKELLNSLYKMCLLIGIKVL